MKFMKKNVDNKGQYNPVHPKGSSNRRWMEEK
jgi:hypothetical protein